MNTKQLVLRLTTGTALGAALLCGGALATTAHAATWHANTPDSIQIEDGQKEYTVKWGDTLWAISVKTNIKVQTLAAASGIADPNRIQVGQKIILTGKTVQVEDAQGKLVGSAPLTSNDKVVANQNFGTTVSAAKAASASQGKVTRGEKAPVQVVGSQQTANQQARVPSPVAADSPAGNAGKALPSAGGASANGEASSDVASPVSPRVTNSASTSPAGSATPGAPASSAGENSAASARLHRLTRQARQPVPIPRPRQARR